MNNGRVWPRVVRIVPGEELPPGVDALASADGRRILLRPGLDPQRRAAAMAAVRAALRRAGVLVLPVALRRWLSGAGHLAQHAAAGGPVDGVTLAAVAVLITAGTAGMTGPRVPGPATHRSPAAAAAVGPRVAAGHPGMPGGGVLAARPPRRADPKQPGGGKFTAVPVLSPSPVPGTPPAPVPSPTSAPPVPVPGPSTSQPAPPTSSAPPPAPGLPSPTLTLLPGPGPTVTVSLPPLPLPSPVASVLPSLPPVCVKVLLGVCVDP